MVENVHSSHIVFESNTFEGNVGMHGGAVHIDNSLMFPEESSE